MILPSSPKAEREAAYPPQAVAAKEGGPVRTTGREHPMEPVSCRSSERGPAGQSACVSGEVVDKYGNR